MIPNSLINLFYISTSLFIWFFLLCLLPLSHFISFKRRRLDRLKKLKLLITYLLFHILNTSFRLMWSYSLHILSLLSKSYKLIIVRIHCTLIIHLFHLCILLIYVLISNGFIPWVALSFWLFLSWTPLHRSLTRPNSTVDGHLSFFSWICLIQCLSKIVHLLGLHYILLQFLPNCLLVAKFLSLVESRSMIVLIYYLLLF